MISEAIVAIENRAKYVFKADYLPDVGELVLQGSPDSGLALVNDPAGLRVVRLTAAITFVSKMMSPVFAASVQWLA
jgi:hypothetical protein